MKYKIVGIVGIISVILLFVVDCGLAFHNLGCEVLTQGSQFYERMSFRWSVIDGRKCLFFLVVLAWYFILLFPWGRYFNEVRTKGRFKRTLFVNDSFLTVFCTIFNIALILGSTIWYLRTGAPDELGLYDDFDDWWRDLILIYVVFSSQVYIVMGLVLVIWDKCKLRKLKNQEGIMDDVKLPVWYWIVSSLPFVLLALTVADARWELF